MASQHPPVSRPLSIVTGASSGIGRELALLAAREGFHLIVAARFHRRSAGAHDEFVAQAQYRLESRQGGAKRSAWFTSRDEETI
jgi:NAD(P)-dependent dehydrogenase (short-subunit alcohol dehydrogenase family)